jgi:(p)ppGpp synthase/HD superfamily hydrolase
MFSQEIERALLAAITAHQGQHRKGAPNVPYVVHPLHVALMLARWNMDEVVIVAGLMHDVVEDCPGWTLARVEAEFGKHVASIVAELTEDKTQSWAERKQRALDHVAHLSPQAAAIKAADKLHNLQSLLGELRASQDPDALWARFKGGRDQTLAMSEKLVTALEARVDPKIGRSLRAALTALVRWCESHELGLKR